MCDRKKVSIENFINDNDSICREERQYAVYLYDILRKYKDPGDRKSTVNNIFIACRLEGAKIEKVFYEATFMRDFFERNRSISFKEEDKKKREEEDQEKHKKEDVLQNKDNSFNWRLIQYLYGKNNTKDWNIPECNLGRWLNDVLNKFSPDFFKDLNPREAFKDLDPQVFPKIIQYMMNVKPDIAVIYEKNQKRQLLFLECKFEGNESYYEGISQTEVQGMVAEFLCESGYLDGISVSEEMENNGENKKKNKYRYQSCIVKFVRTKPNNKEIQKGKIQISDLIKLNDDIFD